MTRSDMAI